MSSTGSSVRTCYRHHDAPAGVVCQRCERPICPQCMHQASVGFHCPECVATHEAKVGRTRALRPFQPIATIVLVAVNCAVWVLGQVIWKTNELFTTSDGAVRVGALFSNGIQVNVATNQPVGSLLGVANGQWYRLVSSGFFHGNLLHLGFNMWLLYVLGKLTEQLFGRTRMLLVYFASLLAGSLGALLVSPDAVTLGASGAIFGLMGAVLVVAKARGMAMRDTGLLWLLGINLVITFGNSSEISVGGHVGGLIGGCIAGLLVVDLPERFTTMSRTGRFRASVAIGTALIVAFFAAGVVTANAHDPNRIQGIARGPAVEAIHTPAVGTGEPGGSRPVAGPVPVARSRPG